MICIRKKMNKLVIRFLSLDCKKVEFVILALPTISAAFVKVLNRIGDRVAF